MFAKLVAVVLALGACGCTLLALRQSRIQVASEIAQTQIRINEHDERLWVLRARIAERVTPEQVEQMARAVAPLRPLVPPAVDGRQELARTRQPQPAPPPRQRTQNATPRVARGDERR